MDNPFYERGTVKTRDGFFGRVAELARTFDRLRVMQSVSVVGGPKIGKSSFLYHLALIGAEQLGADYICRYLDVQGVTSGREFFERAVEKLGGRGDTHRDLARAIAGKKVVLCLDEFEHTAGNPKFDVDFFNVLRSLAQTGELALVVATQTPLPELSHRSTVRTSPFYNIFAPLLLESFTEDEAREMLAALSARGGRPFTDDEIDWVIRVAGTHPWRLQALACHLFKAVERGEPDRARVKRLYREEMQPAGQTLDPPRPWRRRSWLWRGPVALGRLAGRLGDAVDEFQKWLVGVAILVAIGVLTVFVVLRITPVAQVLDWLRSVFGG